MKQHALSLLALGAALLTAGFALGQSQTKSTAPATGAQKQAKLIHISTLNTVEANREFQTNVQLLQAQRQAVLELNAALEKEKDSKKKQEIKTQLDTVLAKLNENNQLMHKTYGFSLDRNYVLEIEKANIYLVTTEEEAAKLDQGGKEKGKEKEKKKK
jgi:hypothetical protein